MDPPRMAIDYFANVRFPSERANSIQIVKMCSAFSRAGSQVTLCHPVRINRFQSTAGSIHAHYGVPADFRLRRLFSLDTIDLLPRALQRPAFRLQSFTFGLRAVWAMRCHGEAVFYIRDNATLALAAHLLPRPARSRLFYEAHDFPSHQASARALLRAARRCGGVVSITRGLQRRFEEAGLPAERLFIAPDGVDLDRFPAPLTKAQAREKIGQPRDRSLAVYAGQLFDWKGVDTLVRAARFVPDCTVLLLGGDERDRQRLRAVAAEENCAERIRFADQVPPGEVPVYLYAADCLVLPNSGRFSISAEYTSPMKLFEYMAARRPIAASDLPSLREILRHEENALLARPDDPRDLAANLSRLLTDQALSDRLASCAGSEVKRFTWERRAEEILAFMESTVKGPTG